MMPVKKIVLLGPESSGKSTLAAALASQYETAWLPEPARSFLEARPGRYDYADLFEIASLQQKSEREIENNTTKGSSPLLFLDTNLLMVQVWSEIVFGRCDNRILNAISKLRYDHYFLCRPDIPWQPDPLREHPAEKDRIRIFHHYLDILNNQLASFTILEGSVDQRMRRAVSVIDSLIQ